MKNIIMLVVVFISFVSSALNLTCRKTRSVNDIDVSEKTQIFHKCNSRHFYEIQLSVSASTETNHTYTIRIMPILKFCKGGNAFPYFQGIIEETGIELSIRKKFACVYVSPLTNWTKDTWPEVEGDWSKGIVNSAIVVEVLRDGDDKPIKTYTNCTLSDFRNKSIEAGRNKMKPAYSEWLTTYVEPRVERLYLAEESRLEMHTWSDKLSKRVTKK